MESIAFEIKKLLNKIRELTNLNPVIERINRHMGSYETLKSSYLSYFSKRADIPIRDFPEFG